MELSYAQRLEDYHLACAFGDQATGFYVDVGAGHPVADNVSYWFYLKGWRGLAIEPQEGLCRRYRGVRPRDAAVCSLIGSRTGHADFHVVDTLHGLSTMVAYNAAKAADLGATYATLHLPVTTLAAIFEEHGVERVDFLKVDVEGAEADVFAGMNWSRWRPRIIVAEALAPNSEQDASRDWEPVLLAQDYRFALFDGLNRFYVAAEETELLARHPKQPASWGAVRHLYEFGRAPDNPQHPDHALARRLVSAFLASLPGRADESLAALLQGLGVPLPEEGDAAESTGSPATRYRALAGSDAFRAALGRIAAPYDGGLMLDDPPEPDAKVQS